MAFSDFKTISEVQERFKVKYAEDDFVEAEPSTPSVEFLRDFEFTREYLNVFASEASRGETIIFPTLLLSLIGHESLVGRVERERNPTEARMHMRSLFILNSLKR